MGLLDSKYSLPKRAYLGPTSTDTRLAFLMNNIGRVTSDSVVYDPFLGTGGLLIPPAHFGYFKEKVTLIIIGELVLVGYVLCFVFVGGLRVGCCGKGRLVV